MYRLFIVSCLVLIFFIPNKWGQASKLLDQTHCDLLGPNTKVLKKVASQSDCHNHCAQHDACQGYVFISSWNRCFLKSSIKRLTQVNLISGLPGQDAKVDYDHSGKDLRQVSTSNASGCESQCRKDSQCGAYTFIKGYQTCWLKKKSGSFRPKVFYCGRKS